MVWFGFGLGWALVGWLTGLGTGYWGILVGVFRLVWFYLILSIHIDIG